MPVKVLLSAAVSVIAVEAKPFDYHSVRGRQAVVQQKGIYEGEALQLRGTSRVQDMRDFGPAWSGDAHLLWLGEPGEVMETVFSVPAEGDYLLSLQMTKAPDYGIFSVGLNGRLIRKGVDLYSGKVELSDLVDLGKVFLEQGIQQLSFTLTGSNSNAHAKAGEKFLLGLDFVRAVPLEPTQSIKAEQTPMPPDKPIRKKAGLEDVQPILSGPTSQSVVLKKSFVDNQRHIARILDEISNTRFIANFSNRHSFWQGFGVDRERKSVSGRRWCRSIPAVTDQHGEERGEQ